MQTLDSDQLLAEARFNKARLPELPADVRPQTQEQAYACQAKLIHRLTERYGGSVIGYKIACTNVLAQRLLRMDGPFSGNLLSSFCFDSPARLNTDGFFMRVVEAEFGFRMARDLTARPKPFEQREVAAAVEGVLPSIEIVDSRFTSWTTVGAASLISDNACHGAWVKGRLVANWQSIDLAAQDVKLLVNGEVRERGSGSAVLGHPLNALLWLANSLNSRGLGLRAGQYITTGVTTDIYMAEKGDHIAAEFGPVGRVELMFD